MNFDEFLQPAIFAVTGKPGAGKSYFSTRLILEEIKRENRNIVTNIPINKKKLREETGKDFYISELETFTDNRFFFTQRGDYSYELQEGETETVKFDEYLRDDDEGVLYIIDEAHLYFNSRNWKYMAQATLSFFTFIRHCGDTLVYLTQKFSDVDSQLRGKTQSFNLIRNLSKERIGWFKRGNGFRVYQYLREKDIDNFDNAVQDFSYPFKMNVAKCYKTSLFNKKRDKNYKIKGVTPKQIIAVVLVLFGAFLWWFSSGGVTDIIKDNVPQIGKSDIVKMETSTNERINAQEGADPHFQHEEMQIADLVEYEFPVSVFGDGGQRFQQITQERADQYNSYIFGENRLCKLSFFVEKIDEQRGIEVTFNGLWNEFAKVENVHGSLTSFSGSIQTEVFSAFLAFVRENNNGTTLKECTIILKETIPCTLSQGYEIPLAKTVGTQGVLQTNYEYRKVGFDLNMVMESIGEKDLLAVTVNNTQILDSVAQVPTMLSFKSENVYDVVSGKTYEIAVFESQVQETAKKLLGKKTVKRTVKNRVFISYGN